MAKQFGNLSYANYSPQYVGQDIEGIKALSKKSDEDYNNNLASLDKMDILENELYQKVDPKDAQYVKDVIEKSKNNLESIRNSGRYEDAQYLLNKSAKDLAMDNNLTGAIQWKQNKDATIKEIQDRVGKDEKENGITQEQADNSIRMIQNNPQNKKKVIWNPETLTFDNKFQGYTPVKYKDIGKEANDFLKDWKADTKVIDGKSINGYYNNITKEWADQDQMNKAASQYIQSNSENKSYMDEQDMFHKDKNFKNPDGTFRNVDNNDLFKVGLTNEKFKKETGQDLDTLTPQQKEGAYYNLLRNHTLLNYTNPSADKYSYNKDTEKNVKDWISEVYMKDALKKKNDEEATTQGIETFGNDKIDNSLIKEGLSGTPLEGSTFSDDGKLIGETTGNIRPMTGLEIGQVYKKYNTTPDSFGKASEMASAEINAGIQQKDAFNAPKNLEKIKFINKLQQDNPSLKDKSQKEVVEAYSLANKSGTQISNDSHSLGGLNTKKISQDVVNDLGGRQILVDDIQGDGTLKGALSKLDLNEDEIKERLLNAKSTSIMPISNNKPGSFKFQIQDTKGVPHTVTISGSNEQQSYYDVASKMAENEKKGQTGFKTFIAQDPDKINKNNGKINDNTQSEYGSVTQIVSDNKGGYQYDTRGGKIYNENETNTWLKTHNLTKEQAQNEGAIFVGNRLMQNLSGKEIMKNSTENWLNSTYNIKNRVKDTKNPIEFTDDEQSNSEE